MGACIFFQYGAYDLRIYIHAYVCVSECVRFSDLLLTLILNESSFCKYEGKGCMYHHPPVRPPFFFLLLACTSELTKLM